MFSVAILGAGELGATLARRLAESGRCQSVVLVDADEGRAKGKALDILQSGPVEVYDTRLVGAANLDGLGALDALVVADPPDLPAAARDVAPPDSFVKSLVRATGQGVLLVASAHGAALVAAAAQAGLPRARVLGSSPLATAGALRAGLGEALEVSARQVQLTVLGLPPDRAILPRGSATVGGLPVERLSPLAERRVLEAVTKRAPGPVALAVAAERVLAAVFARATSVLPSFAVLEGEYGHRHAAVAVPCRLGRGRLQGVVEVPLETVDRTAFDNLAERAALAVR
jgi:malate dehydrogenase